MSRWLHDFKTWCNYRQLNGQRLTVKNAKAIIVPHRII